MALLTGIADPNLSLQQTRNNFTAMPSSLPPFTLTPFAQSVLPPTLKVAPLSAQHLFSHEEEGPESLSLCNSSPPTSPPSLASAKRPQA